MDREELWAKLRRQVEKGSPKAHVTLAKLIELERAVESGDEAGIQIPPGCQVINRIPKLNWLTDRERETEDIFYGRGPRS